MPEDAPLGAAATFAGRLGKPARSSSDSKSEGRARRPRRRRFGPGAGLLALVVGAVLLALIPLVGTALQKTPRDRVGISYGGGPFEGSHFQKIVEPGHGLFFNGFFDPLYLYPADQLNYIVAKVPARGDEPASGNSVTAPSADRVEVEYQVAVYYKLNTDRLQEFHEELGLRYEAFTSDGWDALIDDTLRQQVQSALQEETRRYEVADIYGDAELLVKIQESVQTTLRTRLEAAMGGEYFCAPTFSPGGECLEPVFIIKQADVPESVSAAYEKNRTSALDVITRQNEVQQRLEEAKGIEALNAALAESGNAYVLLKAIESGKINFWVLPDDGGVNLTAPTDAAPAPPTDG